MQFDKETIYKILLIILFIIVIIQILKFFAPQTPKVILGGDDKYENMQSVLGESDATFYVRDDRYLADPNRPELVPIKVSNAPKELVPLIMPDPNYESKLEKTQNCICGAQCSCRSGIAGKCSMGHDCHCRHKMHNKMHNKMSNNMQGRWNVDYPPGANNNYSDAIWQYSSPRMVLDNGCISCGKYEKDIGYNVPNGVASDLSVDSAPYDNDQLSMLNNLPETNKRVNY